MNIEYSKCWLNYKRIPTIKWNTVHISCEEESDIAQSAVNELTLALTEICSENTVIVTSADCNSDYNISLKLSEHDDLYKEDYSLTCTDSSAVILAAAPVGLLYGAFAFLRAIQTGEKLDGFFEKKHPSNPLRMLNHWDNMDGSIERGYSGTSFFLKDDDVVVNARTEFFARLAASVGINGIVINNVNVKGSASELIMNRYRKKILVLSAILKNYGISLYLSLNFASPIETGGLATADPLDESVIAWWKKQMSDLYADVPKLGGFLVKADSEGRPGPFTYGRTHADGANLLAEAIEPYGGIVIWRCFVYNCKQDWRDKITDRARSGFDNFMPIDGKFRSNVILQIKNGPMDFQVREPIHPLFSGLKNTNMMLEVQIAQEYTGQQRHVCYLIPWFKEVLGFHTYCGKSNDKVADIVSGETYNQTCCGMAAVSNTGDDYNWTGHELAAANLYGFGRLSFDTELSAEAIAEEWIKQTFSADKAVVENISNILMMSWPAYEKYTAPLGIGWMVNPNNHYGPSVDGYEYDRWGTYHRADHKGLGVDRSSRGTGYSLQYNEPNASMYDNIESCPEELLLFFHYIPYKHKLSSGKTVIQHIYDTHFEGVEDVEKILSLWTDLESKIDSSTYLRVLSRLNEQYKHSKEWRDVICSYFMRKSDILDEKSREIY